MDINNKKFEMQKLINDENGINFHRNIDLGGYCFYKGKSFISFKIEMINGVNVCIIKYIYLTNKNDLVKLLSFCINFWAGHTVKFIYFLEHARTPNYCKKYLTSLGFTLVEEERPGVFKHEYKSTNGSKEDEIREYYL